jgi:hypothetical protein
VTTQPPVPTEDERLIKTLDETLKSEQEKTATLEATLKQLKD